MEPNELRHRLMQRAEWQGQSSFRLERLDAEALRLVTGESDACACPWRGTRPDRVSLLQTSQIGSRASSPLLASAR